MIKNLSCEWNKKVIGDNLILEGNQRSIFVRTIVSALSGLIVHYSTIKLRADDDVFLKSFHLSVPVLRWMVSAQKYY